MHFASNFNKKVIWATFLLILNLKHIWGKIFKIQGGASAPLAPPPPPCGRPCTKMLPLIYCCEKYFEIKMNY